MEQETVINMQFDLCLMHLSYSLRGSIDMVNAVKEHPQYKDLTADEKNTLERIDDELWATLLRVDLKLFKMSE